MEVNDKTLLVVSKLVSICENLTVCVEELKKEVQKLEGRVNQLEKTQFDPHSDWNS